MYELKTDIEIAASPEAIREMFLDFQQIPKYHSNGFIRSLGPVIPDKPLEPGDRMHVILEGAAFDPIVLENSPTSFGWRGSVAGIFTGDHRFCFEPSKRSAGSTTFVQKEEFTGILGWVMGEGFLARAIGMREKTRRGFESYNRDLKRWIEEGE